MSYKKKRFSGNKLKKQRMQSGLELGDVVMKLWSMGHKKASVQLVRNYETDKNIPGLEYAVSLASIYDCSVQEFVK